LEFKKGNSHIRAKKNKAVVGGKSKPYNLFRNWLHQGFFYLGTTERIGRIFLEIIPTVCLAFLLSYLFNIYFLSPFIWIFSIFLVHTLNWVFNNNWWACVLFAFPYLRNPGEHVTCLYLEGMKNRINNDDCISGLLLFGSVARGEWHYRSDLDMRIFRRIGFLNGIKALFVLWRERVIAVIQKQPLDIYLADDIDFLKKMRDDELPIFFKKMDSRLENKYPNSEVQSLQSLRMGSGPFKER
jgi:predicted nucleotidyltransferase